LNTKQNAEGEKWEEKENILPSLPEVHSFFKFLQPKGSSRLRMEDEFPPNKEKFTFSATEFFFR